MWPESEVAKKSISSNDRRTELSISTPSRTEPAPTAFAPSRFHARQTAIIAAAIAMPRCPATPAGQSRPRYSDEQRGIDGHIKDAGHQREPSFLKAPERPHGAAHPDVKTAFSRQCGGEFAHHQPRRQTPDQRSNKKNDDGELVARVLDQFFHAIRAAGNHEICGRRQR